MMARSIGSIIWTSISGGTKIIAKLYLALRRSRGQVKKSAKTFYNTMLNDGIPREIALDITSSYANPGLELLKIRNIVKMVRELSD
ncbi:MAG: hypothetical protein ACXAEF_03510 [Candidatus Thorarchaeota archaeon]|jgi:hypothetical protein